LTGDLIYWGLREICKRRLWKRAAVFIGAHWGTRRKGRFNRDFERQMKEGHENGASLYMGNLRREPGMRAPLLGTLKDM
jgi:hypothetical protein